MQRTRQWWLALTLLLGTESGLELSGVAIALVCPSAAVRRRKSFSCVYFLAKPAPFRLVLQFCA